MIDSTAVVDGVRLSDLDLAALAKIPQTTKVRNHLIRFGSITDAQARDFYGISRLSSVIYKLRYRIEPLMHIETEMIYGRNRFGQPVQYGKYIFMEG
ncbi:MAG: hypothetical protein IJ594_03485 [Oscillospiraceae bacterium]|nr:hypothetical protein [Oscillospiraceae bacterium]